MSSVLVFPVAASPVPLLHASVAVPAGFPSPAQDWYDGPIDLTAPAAGCSRGSRRGPGPARGSGYGRAFLPLSDHFDALPDAFNQGNV